MPRPAISALIITPIFAILPASASDIEIIEQGIRYEISEEACSNENTIESEYDLRVFSDKLVGDSFGCDFVEVKSHKGSYVAEAVCSGEGSTWTDTFIVEKLADGKLSVTSQNDFVKLDQKTGDEANELMINTVMQSCAK